MDSKLLQQAVEVTDVLHRVWRSLFTINANDPAIEIPGAQLRVCGILLDRSKTMSELSRDLNISLSAMTQLTDRLVRANLVEKVPGPNDRRVKCLQLTDHGKKMIERRRKDRVDSVSEVLAFMSAEDRQKAILGLKIILNATNNKSGNEC